MTMRSPPAFHSSPGASVNTSFSPMVTLTVCHTAAQHLTFLPGSSRSTASTTHPDAALALRPAPPQYRLAKSISAGLSDSTKQPSKRSLGPTSFAFASGRRMAARQCPGNPGASVRAQSAYPDGIDRRRNVAMLAPYESRCVHTSHLSRIDQQAPENPGYITTSVWIMPSIRFVPIAHNAQCGLHTLAGTASAGPVLRPAGVISFAISPFGTWHLPQNGNISVSVTANHCCRDVSPPGSPI
jgi:hypothetical protein